MKLIHLALATVAAVLLGMSASYAAVFDANTLTHAVSSNAVMAIGALIPAHTKLRGILSVRAETPDIKAALENINRGFEEFKAEHKKELEDVRKDVVQSEKVDRINADIGKMNAAIDELNIKMALGNVPGKEGEEDTAELKEYKADFNEWVRTGEGEGKVRSANKVGVMASMSVGSNPDGGFTAPVEWDRQITDKLVQVSPMRRFASIQNVRGQGFKPEWLQNRQQAAQQRASPASRKLTHTDIWADALREEGILPNEPVSHSTDILDAGYGNRHQESNVHPLRIASAGR